MTELETLILTRAANESEVTSDSPAFSAYPHAQVCLAMWELAQAGWFEAQPVQTHLGGAVAVGRVSERTRRQFSLANEH